MAQPTNLWSTYGVGWPGLSGQTVVDNTKVGNRENLMEAVVILDPFDTAALNLLPKEDLDAPYAEWLTDVLEATSTAAALEGETFGGSAITGRTRYANTTQIRKKDFVVSRTQNQTAQRGMTPGSKPSEYQRQLYKRLKEVMRDVDARLFALGSATWASITAGVATARRTNSFRAWGGAAITANQSGAFATSTLSSLHELMDTAGADPDTLFCSSGVKADISNGFMMSGALFGGGGSAATPSPVRRVNMAQSDTEVGAVIEILRDDFGRIMIVRDRWMPQAAATVASGSSEGAAYVLCDRSMLKVCFFQRPVHVPLATDGDYERGFVVTEFLTKLLHPSSLGIAYNVIT